MLRIPHLSEWLRTPLRTSGGLLIPLSLQCILYFRWDLDQGTWDSEIIWSTHLKSSAETRLHEDRRTSRGGGSCPRTPACPHWCHCGWGWPPPLGWPRNLECHCFEEEWAPDTPPRTPSCPPEPQDCMAGHLGAVWPGHRTSHRKTGNLSAPGWIW